MRVLQVSDGYPPATGGLERIVSSLARELAGRGHPTAVATLELPDVAELEVERPGEPDAVTVHRLVGLTKQLRRFGTDAGHQFHPTSTDPLLVRRLHELVEQFRPDVVHAHGWMLNSALSLKLPPGVALVTTLHDYGLVCAKKTMIQGDRLDQTCPGPSLRRCLPCARGFYGVVKGSALTLGLAERRRRWPAVHQFLPISEAVARASLPGVPDERVRIVPSFVADDLAEVAARTPRPDFLPDGDFVLFVGALGEHKGLGVLARAHQAMRHQLPLVVIGAERPDTVLPVSTAQRPVIVRTRLPHEQIMAAFAAAAVAVAPSRWPEPQGLVAVEAMAVGTAPVVTDVGGLGEIVTDGTDGLVVPPGDVDALAAALDRLLENPGWRAELGAAARETASRYTASAVLPQVLDAYTAARAIAAQPAVERETMPTA